MLLSQSLAIRLFSAASGRVTLCMGLPYPDAYCPTGVYRTHQLGSSNKYIDHAEIAPTTCFLAYIILLTPRPTDYLSQPKLGQHEQGTLFPRGDVFLMYLTVLFAAQIFGTSRVLANDGFVTLHAAVVVGAHVARAKEFAALAFLALVVVARHRFCVRDWSVTTIAGDAVAVLCLRGAEKGESADGLL